MMNDEEIRELRKYDPVPTHALTPAQLNFCGWVELTWGWKCWVGNSMAHYHNKIVQDGYGEPPIKMGKKWYTVKEFKSLKIKDLQEKKVKKQRAIMEKVDNL